MPLYVEEKKYLEEGAPKQADPSGSYSNNDDGC